MQASSHERAPLATASIWRIVLVASILFLSIGTTLPDIVLPWFPTAEFGFAVDGVGNVIEVDPGLPADRAGVRVGDRADFRATPLEARRSLSSGTQNRAQPGTRATFSFERGAARRAIPLVAEVVPRSLADNITNVLLVISQVGLALITAWLVLRNPSRMTWAFFLYGTSNSGIAVTLASLLPTAAAATVLAIQSLFSFQSVWLFIFALRFPSDAVTGWRRAAERATLALLPFLIPFNCWFLTGHLFGVAPHPAVVALFAFLDVAGLLAAAVTFIATYAGAADPDRARIRWVMLGLVVGFGGQLVWNVGSELPGVAFSWPLWLLNLAQASQISVALTVAYAIIRHRVFDVRFFIGRAVVYAVITGGVVALLSLVDLAAGKMLAGTGLAAIGEAGLAVIVGVSLSGVHKRIEGFVDTTLFRSRIAAQARLRRVSRGLSHVSTVEALEHVIVHEPAAAFRLTSAAWFRRTESGSFARGESIGWENAALQTIGADDPLVLQLLGSNEVIAMQDVTLPAHALPAGHGRPSFAMPMLIRTRLEAIVFYGPHDSQEELDPAEIETLERLLSDAAGAYDHVRAEIVQRRLRELETQNAQLRALRVVS